MTVLQNVMLALVNVRRMSTADAEKIGEMLDVMVNLMSEGITMYVITHKMGFARKATDRVLFIDQGKIVETGKADEFFAPPEQPGSRFHQQDPDPLKKPVPRLPSYRISG